MSDSLKQFGLRAISGEDKSLSAALTRGATLLVEPFYRATMSIRNACYDHGIFRSHNLQRPTISVGNITTGGTGKTPVVAWLANQLRNHNRHPAVLLRGYGAGTFSDEAQILDQNLNGSGTHSICIQANPSRIEGAAEALKQDSQIDVFVLDDAFQHRRAARNFNLVLISATQPFGFGHVLPRGLLRESLYGLKRADAFLITRCSLISSTGLERIVNYLGTQHPSIPIFKCDHQTTGIWDPMLDENSPIGSYQGERVFLIAGIGDPKSFSRQMTSLGYDVVGQKWFSDHHEITHDEIIAVRRSAQDVGADIILTTEKDWVKMKKVLPQAGELSFGVVKLQIIFHGDDESNLLNRILISIPTFTDVSTDSMMRR